MVLSHDHPTCLGRSSLALVTPRVILQLHIYYCSRRYGMNPVTARMYIVLARPSVLVRVRLIIISTAEAWSRVGPVRSVLKPVIGTGHLRSAPVLTLLCPVRRRTSLGPHRALASGRLRPSSAEWQGSTWCSSFPAVVGPGTWTRHACYDTSRIASMHPCRRTAEGLDGATTWSGQSCVMTSVPCSLSLFLPPDTGRPMMVSKGSKA